MPGIEPQRSCVSCGSTKDKRELLRFVLTPEKEVVPDLLAKLPGRGAYTCIDAQCLKDACARNRFARSFKGAVMSPVADAVIASLTAKMENRIASYVSLANKAGQVVSGSDQVMEYTRGKRAGLIIVAKDISIDIRDKVLTLARNNDVAWIEIFDKERLGALIGKSLRSVVALGNGGFAATMMAEAKKYRNFLEGGTDAR